MAAHKILIVDDNVPLAENLREVLSAEGFDACAAGSAREALGALGNNDYALVISDMRMPSMSGLELLRVLRRDWPHLPAVMMTASSTERNLEAVREDGALAVLFKPIDLRELTALAHRILAPAPRVLVLEPDPSLRTRMVELLHGSARALPFSARNAEEARRVFDSVSLDLMIVGAGPEAQPFVRAVRAMRADLPLLLVGEALVSATEHRTERLRCPFANEGLISAVQRLI